MFLGSFLTSLSTASLITGLLVLVSSTASSLQQPFSAPADHFGISGHNATFDYVIVGGGTAGLALAYRLAQNASLSVAVIEAGGFYEIENGNQSVVPAYNLVYDFTTPDSQWDTPLVDWGFLTTPQAGAQGQQFHYSRGKTLGGW